MSITETQTDDFEYVDWIEKAIEKKYIIFYDNVELTNRKEIKKSKSSIGKIFQANWKKTDTLLVVKIPFELNIKEIVNELKLQKEVDFHANILRLYGISKTGDQYSLILEYADGGTLHSHLEENFTKLTWDDKYRLALQLASAIECIHNKDIIHCDLHAHNVLIHKNNIKLADFGLSKKTTAVSNYSNDKVFGILPYIDPKFLNNIFRQTGQRYVINTRSDIYSMGVLFWQLSSGVNPFHYEDYDERLTISIVQSERRENIIKDTPIEYSNLYIECWSDDPHKRPTIEEVVSSLKQQINKEIDPIINEKELPEGYLTDEWDNDSMIISITMDEDFDLITNDFIQIQNNLVINLNDSTDIETIINELIKLLNRIQDEIGYNFTETKKVIDENIPLIQPSPKNISNWLIKNQTSSQYIFFLGFLYSNGIFVEKDYNKAFKLFLKASEDNYSISQVYLGKSYENGIGIKKDLKEAFNWYKKAAKNDNKFAQFYLGECYRQNMGVDKNDVKSFEWYEKSAMQEYNHALLSLGILYECGIGIGKDLEKAFEYYEKAAINGNRIAQKKFGYFYEYGKGTKKDIKKALEWYEKSAKKGYSNAQYILGYYYDKGIGVQKNLEKAFYWYEKAAENGNKFGQFHLGKYYYYGITFEKDVGKSFELYEKSAKQGYSNAQFILGILYENEKKDFGKAFEWYEKAAKNGHKFAQSNLGYFYEKGRGMKKNIEKAIEWYKKSADQNYGNAQCNLGFLYEKGKEIDIDLEKAFYWYKRAAENGYGPAHYYLGKFYQDGICIEKNESKAFEHYKKSVDKGYLKGTYLLGYFYENGIGTDIDKEEAFKLYEMAAKEGDRDAQKRLELISNL